MRTGIIQGLVGHKEEWLSPQVKYEPQQDSEQHVLRAQGYFSGRMLEEAVGSRRNSREPSEKVTAVVTGSDGSWTRVVAMEIETDLEGGADSIC